MIKLLLIGIALFGIWYWRNLLRRTPDNKRKGFIWNSVFLAVLVVSLALVLTGRIHWIGAFFAALIPIIKWGIAFALRAMPLIRLFGSFTKAPSQFRTQSLFVKINFATQQIDGEILHGPHQGRRLGELTKEELQELAKHFQQNDTESFVLLNAYILRSGTQSDFDNGSMHGSSQSYSTITENEAIEILGLDPGASEREVIRAHKRLIQRLHPDRGGSEYLATKINAAKEKLLSPTR